MRPGIPQGYIEFGTIAHKTLMAALHYETFSLQMLYQDFKGDGTPEQQAYYGLSLCIRRLVEHGFLYEAGRDIRPFGRSFRRYSLYPNKGAHVRRSPLTQVEREARYRARKRIKVPSVFAFRGQIQI